MMYKVVLPLRPLDKTLVCGHSNESYWEVLPHCTVYHIVQGGYNLKVCRQNPSV